MITVHNKRRHDGGQYVGRPSPLGNPYVLRRDGTRDQVIALYEHWLRNQVKRGNSAVLAELHRLADIHKRTGKLELVCWCAPQRCHADVIKAVLIENLTGHGSVAAAVQALR